MSATNDRWPIRQASHRPLATAFDPEGASPLLLALRADDDDAIQALLILGSPVGLHEAAMLDDATTLRHLIAGGADALMRTQDGWSALHLAAWSGAGAVVDTLLGLGLWVDQPAGAAPGITPLGLAAAAGRASVAQQLLDAGADPSRSDAAGWTPLHHAAYRGDLHLAKRLLVAGANIHALCGDTSPLGMARRSRHRGLVALLTQLGAVD